VLLRPLAELDALDGVEALAHVRLHGVRVARLRQNLQEFVVGQEVKAREPHPFGFEILFEALLDLVQRAVGFLEVLKKPRAVLDGRDHLGVVRGGRHSDAPVLVDVGELYALLGELLLDVVGREDGLQVPGGEEMGERWVWER